MGISGKDICDYLNKEDFNTNFYGDKGVIVEGFCSLNKPRNRCITWVKKASEDSLSSFALLDECIVVAKEIIPTSMKKCCFILTEEPKKVFFSILRNFFGQKIEWGISDSAIVKSASLPKNVYIGEHTYISPDVVIGEGTIIEHNVSIDHSVRIGKNCIIHSGTVIGVDGFGYFTDEDGIPQKVEHFGGVVIGDSVEIGSNACIDRGTMDDTVIEDDVKIDNLVHIGHNVHIKKGAMVVAGAIVCGSAKLGCKSYIAPGGIVKNQLEVGENAFIGLGAVLTKPAQNNMVFAGVPANPIREVKKGDK